MSNWYKRAIIQLGYFKKGDDLGYHLEKTGDPVKAFLAHAEQMREVAHHLHKISEVLSNFPKTKINICADPHHIGIEAPSEIIDLFTQLELAELDDE